MGFEHRIAFVCPQDKQEQLRQIVKAFLQDDYLEDDMIYGEYEAIVKERDDLAEDLRKANGKLNEIKQLLKGLEL